MINRGKRNLLGVQIDAVDYDGAVMPIIEAARLCQAMAVSALAVHGVMSGVFDRTHRYRLNHLDMVVPDGQPVRWALNWLYDAQLGDRVYGPTLMLKVCEAAAREGLPIFLYGNRDAVLDALSDCLRTRIPGLRIGGVSPSRFRCVSLEEKQAIVEQIRESGAAITFVGLGCPRQEVWVYEYRDDLGMPLIAVGAAFDFHAGILPQAPSPLQRLGLEWLYRLLREPRRLWKRYIFLNPLYLLLLLVQALRLIHFDPLHAQPPVQEIRYG